MAKRQTVVLGDPSRRGFIPTRCVRIAFYDVDNDRRFVFLTHNFALPR